MATAQPNALQTLEEGLTFHTVDSLKKLLKLLLIKEKPTRKAELVEAIAQYLRSPQLKEHSGRISPLRLPNISIDQHHRSRSRCMLPHRASSSARFTGRVAAGAFG